MPTIEVHNNTYFSIEGRMRWEEKKKLCMYAMLYNPESLVRSQMNVKNHNNTIEMTYLYLFFSNNFLVRIIKFLLIMELLVFSL